MSGDSTQSVSGSDESQGSRGDTDRPGEGYTLLLADDDAQLREALTMHLESRGYEVREAADGEEALAEAKRLKPHVAILDIVMPGANGWDVARSLRNNPETKDIRLLMLSGIGQDILGPNLPILGGDVGLDKPFDLDELDEALRVLLTS
jgi:DNA-binding response OmpR family regulator